MKKNQPAKKAVAAAKIPAQPKRAVSSQLQDFGIILIILIGTIVAFLPTFSNQFTNWDDENYVLKDGLIRSLSGDNIIEIFKTKQVMGNYHPIAILSLAVDYALFKTEDPGGYHMMSLLFHLISIVLVFFLTKRLFNRPIVTIVTTLLFAIHPMRVESVAWVSERKDQLYVLFYIAGLLTYLLYLDTRKALYMVLTVPIFVLSVLSKGQAVTFPIALFIFDYIRKEKLLTLNLITKLVLIAFSVFMGIVAIHAQKASDSINDIVSHNFIDRLIFACYALFGYLTKLFLPLNLSTFYPYPDKIGNSYPDIVYISIIAPLFLLTLCIFTLKNKTVTSGLAFFMLNIILLLQLLPVGNAVMADRYSYLAYLGLFWVIAYGLDIVNSQWPQWRMAVISGIIGISITLAYLCYNRTIVWHDSEALWNDVLAQFPNIPVAQNNLGSFYQKMLDTPNSLPTDLANAKIHFDNAIKLQANYKEARTNRSDIFRRIGKPDSAILDANAALKLDSNYTEAHQNRGIAYAIAGKLDSAMIDFDWLLTRNPRNSDAYANRGNLNAMLNRPDSALSDYSQCIHLNPGKYDAYGNRARVWIIKKDFKKAFEDINIAIQHFPNNANYFYTRAQAYYNLGQYPSALSDFTRAKQLGLKFGDEVFADLKQKMNQ